MYIYIYKVPLRDVVDLKSWGCSKFERGSTITRRPYLLRAVLLYTAVQQDEVRRRVFDFSTALGKDIMFACIFW